MAEDEAAEGGKKGKKGKKDKGEGGGQKSNLVPAVILAVGFVVGGRMMGSSGGQAAAAAPEAAAAKEAAAGHEEELDCAKEDIKKPPTEGGVYKLDAITVNLKDGHYLKVGIALVLDKALDKKKLEEEGSAAMALDPTIAVLGGRQKEEFESNRAIQAAKEEITAEVRPLFHCKVIDVKFTEFVVQ
jgi:flagellar protein FliL